MIIQVPGINGLGKTRGEEKAPKVICESLNLKSKKLKLNNSNVEEQEKEIYENANEILNSKEKPIFIGGDHSISYSLTKAFLETKENPALIIFDAHYDLMRPMQNPTHEEWLRALVEEKNFKNILLVGIRKESENIDEKEMEFANKKRIKIIFSDEFDEKKNEILEFCKNKRIYLSLDLDVLDAAVFSSTGYSEKAGLTEKQLIEILKELKDKISAADIVEYNPELDKYKSDLEAIKKILKALGEA